RGEPPLSVLECLHGACRHTPFLPLELVGARKVPALYPRAYRGRLLPEQFREVADREIEESARGGGLHGRDAREAIGQLLEHPIPRHERARRHGGQGLLKGLQWRTSHSANISVSYRYFEAGRARR